MSEKNIRPRSGSKAIAIDNRAQLAKIRLWLLLSLLSCAAMALVFTLLLNH